MNLEETFSAVSNLLDRDDRLAALPFIKQIADEPAEQEAVRTYNKEIETALKEPGIAFVAVMAGGELASESRGALDLDNGMILSVLENTKTNNTGLTAFQVVRRAMRVLQHGQVSARGARSDIRLGKQAYELGPIGQGKVVYFINLLVRSTEDLGPVSP